MTQSKFSKNDFRFDVALKVEGINCRRLLARAVTGIVTLIVIGERIVTWLLSTTP